MDFDLPDDVHPDRKAERHGLAEHPQPSGRQLAEAGYVAPHWPAPWGLDADPIQQLVIDDELKRAGVRRPMNSIGIGWAGPTILHAGTQEQKDRYLMQLLAGEAVRPEEHTSELQSLMRTSYAGFCLTKQTYNMHTRV